MSRKTKSTPNRASYCRLMLLVCAIGCGKGSVPAVTGSEVSTGTQSAPVSSAEDPFLVALFASPNDFQLVNKVFIRISRSAAGGRDSKRVAQLLREQKVVLDVWGAGGIIGNGGFAYLFTSDIADLPGIADSYDAIGADDCAAAVRRALKIFPDSNPPSDVDARNEIIEKLSESEQAQLEKCSRVIWFANARTQRQVARYVRNNQAAFQRLSPARVENIQELQGPGLPPPTSDAPAAAVVAWLRSIGGEVQTRQKFKELKAGVQSIPLPSGDPIVAVRLSRHRNSTDQELELMSKLESLRELRKLDLEETSVTLAGLRFIPGFPNLKVLDVSAIEIDDNGLAEIAAAHQLCILNVSRNPITDIGLAQLASLTELRELTLFQSPVRGDGLVKLRGLPIEILHLQESAVTDEGLRAIDRFDHLRRLDLTNTSISDLAIVEVSQCPNLAELELGRTAVTDQGLRELASLKSLTRLSLPASAAQSAVVSYLKEKLPDVSITFD